MGNAGGLGGGWLYSEEAAQIVIRLHDARNLGLGPEERLSGVVNGERMWKEVPAVLPVSSGTATLSIDFQVVLKRQEEKGGRFVGDMVLPLEYIATRCGGSLYHMWLPLQLRGHEHYEAKPADANPLEFFERALRNAARDPRLVVVCISVSQKDSPQDLEWYDFNATATEKSMRFYGLLQSHAQHARLLQALYRHCRSSQQSRMEDTAAQQRALDESWAEPTMRPQSHGLARTSTQSTQSASGYPRAEVERNSGEAGLPRMLPTTDGGADAKQAQQAQQEASRLRQEIESTTEEANARINQASDAIRTLKERLAARQAEHERLRQETSELQRESERLEAQNVQLEGQLRHPAGALAAPDGRQEEVQRLQREARFLGEQKDALVQILEDLYSAAGKESPKAAVLQPRIPEPRAESPPRASSPDPGFTALLPRPSRLFEDG